ncbi:MAG: hypothetical protein J0L80_12570 [Chitinophagales bacterium]|nr:hypothetical protein [Chitinophagales bacterium]
MRKALTIIAGTVLAIVLSGIISLFLSAIPEKSNRADTKMLKGKLISITSCCSGSDIIFHIANDGSKSYYINRGIENGLDIKKLEKDLIGKQIIIYYHRHSWNIINYRDQIRHICELRTADKVYYTEIAD